MTVQPPDPLSMRASDSDRHAVADVLGSAYAEGRLNLAEYHERLDALMQTTTYGELVPFVLDLPNVEDKLPTPLRRDLAQPQSSAPSQGVTKRSYSKGGPALGHTVAVLGENKRRGSIHVSGGTTVVAVLGEALLDLSKATFASADVTITLNAVLGQATLIVPADAILTMGVVPVLGQVSTPDDLGPTRTSSNPPHIMVRGVALLGEIRIERSVVQLPSPDTNPQLDQ
jgi:hypothetical protein